MASISTTLRPRQPQSSGVSRKRWTTFSWKISRVDENDNQVTPDQYLRLLRAMLAVCGNVSVLVLPKSWKGVMDEVRRDYFPNLEELIVYRDEPVKMVDRNILV